MINWWWVPIAAWAGCFVWVFILRMCKMLTDYKRNLEENNTLDNLLIK